jgi:hypothetical protein
MTALGALHPLAEVGLGSPPPLDVIVALHCGILEHAEQLLRRSRGIPVRVKRHGMAGGWHIAAC